ncbi:YggS family pyridoxal phosphate-dependent enzyme [Paenibacillus contaminans]|uniref:Pyridoxal phosphate homeostasis protein n=1 Tax=Paenibacillus contaminans TaxID=450362 RepID=A0A329MPH6_9BACL|nr:YggS family pyridoxal phosphate-dependent enzyme [Paenibacillus contaminans]RAV19817.1 YggS family pyridoxal phosphate-dependent enzyme [Paenibacillus contaminans]
MGLKERIAEVDKRVEEACRKAGRSTNDIHIIAVTKYVSVEATAEVVKHGIREIGENRLQDAAPKREAIGDEASWHFIGHLQTNKVKDVIGKFEYIHSLDRPSLAAEIDKKAAALGIEAKCFIQVNVSGEESKYGLAPESLFSFAESLKSYGNIRVVGLMTMAPLEAEPEATRPVFRGLRELRDELNSRSILPYEVSHLSMGMSNDFEVAIEEGATWIRLGTVLVGK